LFVLGRVRRAPAINPVPEAASLRRATGAR